MQIRTEDLKAVLNGNPILKGVSLQAGEKQLIGVIGPNGSGKSTLLKCIYRVLQPTGGAVFLDGKPLSEYSFRESALKIAVVAQHNYYNFDFSVRDVVLMGRSPHKKTLERDNAQDFRIVEEALTKVGMLHFAERSFSTLSGGEQQRVILARALAQQTPCLILDEPTNHLDIKYQLQLMDLVRGLDRTVITAVHDLNIAAMYCDWLYAVKDGRVVGQGTPQTLLTPEFIRQVYDPPTATACCGCCTIPVKSIRRMHYETNRNSCLPPLRGCLHRRGLPASLFPAEGGVCRLREGGFAPDCLYALQRLPDAGSR